MADKQFIEQLLKDFELLKKENARLVLRVELEEKLSKYEHPKNSNSNNSSIPPSQDPNRITKSVRKNLIKKLESKKDIREVN